jgi:hypothetical protein
MGIKMLASPSPWTKLHMARNIFSTYESSIQLKLSILFVGKVKITPFIGSIVWLQAILCGTMDIKSDAINSLTWDVLNVRQIMHGEKYLVVPGTCNLLPIVYIWSGIGKYLPPPFIVGIQNLRLVNRYSKNAFGWYFSLFPNQIAIPVTVECISFLVSEGQSCTLGVHICCSICVAFSNVCKICSP